MHIYIWYMRHKIDHMHRAFKSWGFAGRSRRSRRTSSQPVRTFSPSTSTTRGSSGTSRRPRQRPTMVRFQRLRPLRRSVAASVRTRARREIHRNPQLRNPRRRTRKPKRLTRLPNSAFANPTKRNLRSETSEQSWGRRIALRCEQPRTCWGTPNSPSLVDAIHSPSKSVVSNFEGIEPQSLSWLPARWQFRCFGTTSVRTLMYAA